MIKNKSVFDLKVGERAYQMICDQDSPLGEVYDVLSQMRNHVLNLMISSDKKNEENKSESCEGECQ